MSTKIFVNLPVNDLAKSVEFFTKLGYAFNPQFTDENATCMIVSEDIYVMLLVRDYFQTFTTKPVAHANVATAVIVALSCESREAVTAIVEKGFAAGGKRYGDPKDYGFMLQWGFEDPDGHIWEHFYMDPSHVQ